MSDMVTEAYNAVLALPCLLRCASMLPALDNEALHGICKGRLGLQHPGFGDLNRIVAAALSNLTCTMRWDARPNGTRVH